VDSPQCRARSNAEAASWNKATASAPTLCPDLRSARCWRASASEQKTKELGGSLGFREAPFCDHRKFGKGQRELTCEERLEGAAVRVPGRTHGSYTLIEQNSTKRELGSITVFAITSSCQRARAVKHILSIGTHMHCMRASRFKIFQSWHREYSTSTCDGFHSQTFPIRILITCNYTVLYCIRNGVSGGFKSVADQNAT
jgi:hypothetical protein